MSLYHCHIDHHYAETLLSIEWCELGMIRLHLLCAAVNTDWRILEPYRVLMSEEVVVRSILSARFVESLLAEIEDSS
ncbi:hypothetical protein NPIL_382871 [Nephila pilipes]|uniref:Uncharacterized protein n=1 Tax=Nephila pilipes TaxID=299642 RepID=A0A8X6QK21_NEPPI|nr:hypothetical protein NPIL_382871 [Nephila pilipes]